MFRATIKNKMPDRRGTLRKEGASVIFAKGVLYLDYNIHINVEGESKDVNYISICTNEACRYYNAPQDTYDYIKSLCTISK